MYSGKRARCEPAALSTPNCTSSLVSGIALATCANLKFNSTCTLVCPAGYVNTTFPYYCDATGSWAPNPTPVTCVGACLRASFIVLLLKQRLSYRHQRVSNQQWRLRPSVQQHSGLLFLHIPLRHSQRGRRNMQQFELRCIYLFISLMTMQNSTWCL